MLLVGIWVRLELLQRICWPDLPKRVLEWAVVRAEGFSCGWQGCWVSKGDVLPSVALGSSMAGGHCTAWLGA